MAFGGATVVGAGRGVDPETAIEVVEAAYRAGLRNFDTASMYGAGRSERLLGEVLAPVRDEIVLITKGGVSYPDLNDLRISTRDSSYEALRSSLEGSLTRLRTDYVDAYLIHQHDPGLTPEAAMENLQRLVDDGLTRAVGFSNFGAVECRRALDTGIPRYVEYSFSLLDRRYLGELDAARQAGCTRLTYGTFVHGMLAEHLTPATTFDERDWRYRARTSTTAVNSGSIFFSGDAYERYVAVADRLRAIADEHGCSLAALVLAVTVREPHTDVALIGCRSVAELDENLAALAIEIDAETAEAVDEVLSGVDRPHVNELGALTA